MQRGGPAGTMAWGEAAQGGNPGVRSCGERACAQIKSDMPGAGSPKSALALLDFEDFGEFLPALIERLTA